MTNPAINNMIMLRDISERKVVLRRIIPQLHIIRQASGRSRVGGLNWNKYFQQHPDDAALLGYGTDKQMWNANNVVGRYLMRTEGVQPGSNGTAMRMEPIVTTGVLLTGLEERRALLAKIIPHVNRNEGKHGQGQLAWFAYFKEHPDDATALGYDIRERRPKVWAANLRMTQNKEFEDIKQGKGPLLPYKVETLEPDTAAKELAHKLQAQQDRIKQLVEELRESEAKLDECRSQLNKAKEIVFDLTMQIREFRA